MLQFWLLYKNASDCNHWLTLLIVNFFFPSYMHQKSHMVLEPMVALVVM